MRRRPFAGFRFAALPVLFALCATSSRATASEPPVTLGEVRATTESGDFSGPLRTLLRDALARTAFGPTRAPFVLSATLVRLDAERVGHGARATAAVSLVLRRAREQSLYAFVSGHATAEAPDASIGETRTDALRAAVDSALRRLPEAVR